MAKKKDVNIDELDDESGKSGKLVSILVAMLIIVTVSYTHLRAHET